jgi:hypothetical protein
MGRLIAPGKRIRYQNPASNWDGELGLMIWTDGELAFVTLDRHGQRTIKYQYIALESPEMARAS